MNTYRKLIALCLVVLSLASCRQELLNVPRPEDSQASSFSGLFEAYWNSMNTNYAFWKEDTTNWDQMYRTYQPRFAQLDINKAGDLPKALAYFRAMSDGLADSHMSITFEGLDSLIVPSLDRKLKAGIYQARPVMYEYDAKTYLDKGYIFGGYPNDSVANVTALCGTIKKTILYLGFDAFDLQEAYNAADTNRVKQALTYFFTYLQNPPPGFKGVILDLRSNHGGTSSDLNFIVSNLIDRPLLVGYSRRKKGPGRLDYLPLVPYVVQPKANAKAVTVPIVVLNNSRSLSNAELTTMAIKALPNGHVVGETTWGGYGTIASRISDYSAGSFTVAGFMKVRIASEAFIYKDGKNYEGLGFPPDYLVPYENSFTKTGDKQLEKALSLMP